MRYIIKAAAVVGIIAGSVVATSGNANAAGISPVTSGVVKSAPIVGHPKCPRCVPAPGPVVHGPFKLNTRGPVGGPVVR